ncbi:hypothetical protein E8E11_007261 [Didymella keratinophila]|nr:hypothetical protein E8E11_007261 [Didymella keratinophila]
MRVRSDVDLRIQDAHGNLVVYPVYLCDHVTTRDLVILDQVVLDHLESIVADKDEQLNASGVRITKLERTLRKTERQRDIAVQVKESAEKVEAQALSALDVARQEKANAFIEVFLLQQALQLAQRGYHDTKGEVTTLRKDLERAHENNDKLHQNTGALHEILNANKVEMINLRKDHEFARTQSKGFLNAMQRSVEGHEAVKMQLLEQMHEERRMAAEKFTELEKRNVELEEMLAVKMRVTRQASQGDLYIPMPDGSSSPLVDDEEIDEGKSNRWFSSLRGRYLNRVVDLEDGLGTQSETASVHAVADSAHPSIRQNNWGVKSLRAPGVWGGRSKESVLPK